MVFKNTLSQMFFLLLLIVSVSSCEEKTSPSSDKIEVSVLAETTKSWNGDTLPHYPSKQPKITILRVTIPPMQKLRLHKHPVINAGILLKGKLIVVSQSGDTLHLEKGQSIVELVNKMHYGKNPSKDEEAEIVVFYAGAEDTPITLYQ